MSKHYLTYSEVCAKHPAEVSNIISAVQKGRSKFKGMQPSDWLWYYDWGVRSQRIYGNDLTKRIEDRLKTVDGLVYLVGQPTLRSSCEWQPVSNEVLRQWATDLEIKAMVEEARIQSLTEEEKRNEVYRALTELMGQKNSGFIVI